MKFVIPGELTDQNTYMDAERANRHKAAKLKKQNTYKCAAIFMPFRLQQPKLPISLHFDWICKNKRKDKDNICFAKKFIFDGMQQAGYIPNDGWSEIKEWTESFHVDKNNPRIEIEIKEEAE
ncbi:RusA family crossover junction endodeoxyribonuclease [Tetragenococcus halophilus]|uniref:RusA family crossover junction endodeoxyribonuclease n=2 Tax=Tetragenococcus halophilus TaxID=51669 RepID=A0AB35HM45_TETHA|nr:hypothetical protein [Tetragenococcus halophilus]MCO8288285.1 RusA family crossover junction endodeoxyribonuclease [Tetragenococcus halophilus]MCO8290236.1 RusA family crossover junction endodeoxyribonuclease [Tetragenococcus halophilus]MCO8294667.1 RusA family crossover junction endodeoxyribonuclease [Tetragenococcus halophilus]MCO8297320.1 RusA family crossover junction endodeoxyribonuclease [Tetragenococcus halophilus]